MIVPRYYEDLSVLHENTMPARAYFIPASKRMDNLVEHREESDRMQLLNGTWKFQYFNSIYDVQEPFFEKDYDTENFDAGAETNFSGLCRCDGSGAPYFFALCTGGGTAGRIAFVSAFDGGTDCLLWTDVACDVPETGTRDIELV